MSLHLLPKLEVPGAPGLAALSGGYFFFGIIMYVYLAICLVKLAGKFGVENSWYAWVPILNAWYMCILAEKPGWWIILLFIPLVNIVIAIMIWMAIAKRAGKPDWLGILMIVPVVNLIIPGYIAFG